MATTREVLTVQLGHYSNFVGSHWWNVQEAGFTYSGKPTDVDHDVLYREGINSKGDVTYTPRLVLLDLKGSLNHLRIEGELYDVPVPDVHEAPWPTDKVSVEVAAELPEKNAFLKSLESSASPESAGDPGATGKKEYNLEKDVSVWSDYLVSRFHPRTVMVTNEYEHNSEHQPFEIYSYGVNLWKNEVFEEEFTDRIRMSMEESDNPQGFHVLFDGTDGFGGIGSCLSEHLADEYRNKSVLAVPLVSPLKPNCTPMQEYIRILNLALALPKVSEYASLVVPLGTDSQTWKTVGPPRSFPFLEYNSKLHYHTSAILATALDTFTLRYRLRTSADRMSDMVDPMSRLGRKVASGSLGVPFGMKEGEYLMDTLERWEGPLWTSLTPNCDPNIEDINQHMWMQSVVLRGVPPTRLKSTSSVTPANQSAGNETSAQILQSFLGFISHGTYSHVSTSDSPCKVTAPFPNIFKPSLGLNGDILLHGKRSELIAMRDVPAIASVNSCDAVGTMLKSLATSSSRIDIRRIPGFAKAGIEPDDYKETCNQLIALAENYEENYEL